MLVGFPEITFKCCIHSLRLKYFFHTHEQFNLNKPIRGNKNDDEFKRFISSRCITSVIKVHLYIQLRITDMIKYHATKTLIEALSNS